jgi:hypothetical protein
MVKSAVGGIGGVVGELRAKPTVKRRYKAEIVGGKGQPGSIGELSVIDGYLLCTLGKLRESGHAASMQ